jgi:dethiobiotin synthetase
MTPGIFITGTHTGVGKTLVAAAWTSALARAGYRVVGLKPVASGSTRDAAGNLRNSDALALQAASSVRLPYDTVNPYCFEPPIAPHLAAEEAGQVIAVDSLVEWYGRATADADIAIIEGAGGWRVPLHPVGFLSDLPEQLGLPAVLVVGLTLGCLNHARLTVESIQHAGRAPFLGWVGNRIDPGFGRLEANLQTLEHLLGGPPLALIPPVGPIADPAAVAEFFAGPLVRAAVAPLLGAVRPG